MEVEASSTTSTTSTTDSVNSVADSVISVADNLDVFEPVVVDRNGHVKPKHNNSSPLVDDRKDPASVLKQLPGRIADLAAPPYDPDADSPPKLPEGHVEVPHFPGVKTSTINQLSQMGGFATNIVVTKYDEEVPKVFMAVEPNAAVLGVILDYLNTREYTLFSTGKEDEYYVTAVHINPKNMERITRNYHISMVIHNYESQPLKTIPAEVANHYGRIPREPKAFVEDFTLDENGNPVITKREVPVGYDIRGLHITKVDDAGISMPLFGNSKLDMVNRGMGLPFAKTKREVKLGKKRYMMPDKVHIPPEYIKLGTIWDKTKDTPIRTECSFEEFLEICPNPSAVLAYVLTGKF